MIHIQDLTKYYRDLCAVDRISLDVHKGEILGLLGPNGAGKTTTLRMLTGFLAPTAGQIRIKEYDIDAHALEIKNLIGYLPESAPLYHDMLVYDYLQYVAEIRHLQGDAKHSRIRELAALCGLNEVMHKPIGVLSKGYKQRVGLAHAMMGDPEILILDEPTSGLDPNQIVEIRDIIRQVGREKTVILSTHILSEAEATCDRVVIINRGKIVADDTTDTLKQAGEGDVLVHMAVTGASADEVSTALEAIDGVGRTSTALEENGTLRITLTCRSGQDLRARIYQRIKKTEWTLLEFYQETQSLEKIFRELTKER